MASQTIYYAGTAGLTDVCAMPANDSLANYAASCVPMIESAAPDTGLYSAVLDDTVSDTWYIFNSAAQPADWSSSIARIELDEESTATSSSSCNSCAGECESYWQFDGVDDYLDIPIPAIDLATTSFTMLIRFQPDINPVAASTFLATAHDGAGLQRMGAILSADGRTKTANRGTVNLSIPSAGVATDYLAGRCDTVAIHYDQPTNTHAISYNGFYKTANNVPASSTPTAPLTSVRIGNAVGSANFFSGRIYSVEIVLQDATNAEYNGFRWGGSAESVFGSAAFSLNDSSPTVVGAKKVRPLTIRSAKVDTKFQFVDVEMSCQINQKPGLALDETHWTMSDPSGVQAAITVESVEVKDSKTIRLRYAELFDNTAIDISYDNAGDFRAIYSCDGDILETQTVRAENCNRLLIEDQQSVVFPKPDKCVLIGGETLIAVEAGDAANAKSGVSVGNEPALVQWELTASGATFSAVAGAAAGQAYSPNGIIGMAMETNPFTGFGSPASLQLDISTVDGLPLCGSFSLFDVDNALGAPDPYTDHAVVEAFLNGANVPVVGDITASNYCRTLGSGTSHLNVIGDTAIFPGAGADPPEANVVVVTPVGLFDSIRIRSWNSATEGQASANPHGFFVGAFDFRRCSIVLENEPFGISAGNTATVQIGDPGIDNTATAADYVSSVTRCDLNGTETALVAGAGDDQWAAAFGTQTAAGGTITTVDVSVNIPADAPACTTYKIVTAVTSDDGVICLRTNKVEVKKCDDCACLPHATGLVANAATAADTAILLDNGLNISLGGRLDVITLTTNEQLLVTAYDADTGAATVVRGWNNTTAAAIPIATTFTACEARSGNETCDAKLC